MPHAGVSTRATITLQCKAEGAWMAHCVTWLSHHWLRTSLLDVFVDGGNFKLKGGT
jgi:hypothetical protein